MSGTFTESVVEDAALAWLESLGRTTKHGPDIAPGKLAIQRSDDGQVVLAERPRQARARLNPAVPPEALEDAFSQAHTAGRAKARRSESRIPPADRGRRDGRVSATTRGCPPAIDRRRGSPELVPAARAGQTHPQEARLPADKQEKATHTVLEQAEALSLAWAA
jgi:hypothetical protein